ncbi:MAG: TonB-dependent receptor [Chitinophagaceae bacterium]
MIINKPLLRGVFAFAFLFVTNLLSFSQGDFQVTGKVTDEDGKPLSDVTIQVKGSATGTATSPEGLYSIKAPSGNSSLIFTSIGFEEQQVAINNRTEIGISMKLSINDLSDVVVIGYGTQKRKNVTGAVSSFDARKLEERPILRVDQALVGQLSGVRVKQTTGTPGKGFSIQIRGSGSISGGNEPLYVIDGFPLTVNSSNTGNGSFATGNPLDNINPNDIESIEVLKDAAAAAIYGSRASNGVVLITTKQGKSGKAKISVNTYVGYNETARKLEMMNGQQWIDQATEVINATYLRQFPTASVNDDYATRLARNGGAFNANYLPDPRWSMPGHPGLSFIDWQDVIERKGMVQNHQISASGGNDAVRYFISGNYTNQEGFVINTDYKAYSLRANLEVNASKNLKIGVNIAPTYSVSQDPGVEGKDQIFHQALSFAPVQEDTMGYFPNIGKNDQYAWSSTTNSPVGKLTYNKGTNKRYRTLGTIFGEYKIIPGLTARTSVNLDHTDNIATTYVSYLTAGTKSARTFTGSNNLLAATSGTYNSYRRQTFVNENTLNYNTVIAKDHSLNVLGGFSYSFDRLDRTSLNSNGGFTSAAIQTLNAAAAVTGNTNSSKSVLMSYFGRLQYGFKDKYFFSGSIRADGSSKFGINDQFGVFPAASLKWIVSDENFMQGIPVISDLKLRASYGINGNDNLPNDYASIATLGSTGYTFGTTQAAVIGQAPNVLANPDLKWEKSKTWDFGLDFGLLKNRIIGSFDIYNKLNTDLLLNVQVLEVTGFQSSLTNIGSVRNIGQELEITSRNMVGKFQWTTSLNVTHNTNKILALAPGQNQIIIPNGFTVSDAILRVGAPINSIYVLKILGFLSAKDISDNVPRYGSNQQPGDFKFEDLNKDGIITEADKQIMGHPNPDYTYGMTNTFRYKGFDLSVLVQGQSGGSIFSQFGRSITRPGQGRSDNHPATFVDRWYSESNQGEGRFSKAFSIYNSPITSATDWLYSSDYIRVRNITLGYNLKKVFKTSIIKDARVYLTLENFFGHDKYVNGLNPEATNTTISTNGAYPEAGDYGAMPLAKSLIFGLNITF